MLEYNCDDGGVLTLYTKRTVTAHLQGNGEYFPGERDNLPRKWGVLPSLRIDPREHSRTLVCITGRYPDLRS